MKPRLLIFATLASALCAQEIPMIDEDHAFPDGLAATEVYRLSDMVVVSTCLHGEWSVQISTDSKRFKFISYSKSYPLGGGGIYRLFSGDYNKDGKIELMACLYNGGRSGSGAHQNQVVFFSIGKSEIKLRATDWIEGFNPLMAPEYFKRSKVVLGPGDADALLQNTTEPNQALEPTTMAVTPAASHPSRQP